MQLFIITYLSLVVALCFAEKGNDADRYAPDPKYGLIGNFPTNYFSEVVPEFVNNRPLIGIVAMEVKGDKLTKELPFAENRDYMGAAFVKLVESAGARAVPLKEDDSDHKVTSILEKINGVILPGGDSNLGDTGYERISKLALKYSKSQFEKGYKFPVLGICRGSQMIYNYESEEDDLIYTDAQNYTVPLMFTDEVMQSQLFGHAPKGLLNVMESKPITFNAHKFGMAVNRFYNKKELMSKYRVISTNYDREGVEFISTFEGRKAPIFGLQWHPEKPAFVFNPVLEVDHSIYSIVLAQYISNMFVAFAKQNPNHFKSREEEEKILIYRHKPFYVGNITETPYEQVYVFDYLNPFTMDKIVNPRRKKGKN